MLESRTDYYRVISESFGSVVPGTREARKTVYNEIRKVVREQSKLAPHRFDLSAEQRALEKAILDIEISAKLGEPIPRVMPGATLKQAGSAPQRPAPMQAQTPTPPAQPYIAEQFSHPQADQFSAPVAQPAMPRIEWTDPAPGQPPLQQLSTQPLPSRAYSPPRTDARQGSPFFQPGFLNKPDRVSYARRADPPPPPSKPRPQPRQVPPQQQMPSPQPDPQHEEVPADLKAALPPPEALRQAGDVNMLDPSQSKKARKVFSPAEMPVQKPRSTARIVFIVILAAAVGGAISYFAKPEQLIAKMIEFVQTFAGPVSTPTPKTPPTGATVSFGEQREPTVAEIVSQAIQQSSQREYSRALATLDEARAKGASGADFYAARAYANWGAGDVPNAISDYTEAIRLDPGNGANYTNRAVAYNSRGEYLLGIRDLERAIAIEPNNPDSWNSRCWARALAGQLQEAIVDCNESLRLRPNDPNTLDSRGFAHLKAGQNSRAIADFEAALKIDPRIASAIYGRGIARMRSGDRAAGFTDIAEARTINPNIEAQFAKFGVR